jgi:hypothetical protein
LYEGRTVFKRGDAVLAMVAGATLLFIVGALMTYRHSGWTWVSIGLTLAAIVFGGGGMVETVVERVELTPDALVIRRLWGTRRIPIEQIERVEEAKGVPPAVRLRDGQWLKLPEVGGNFGNSARAWLRARELSHRSTGAA